MMKISLGIPRVRLSKMLYSALKFAGFFSSETSKNVKYDVKGENLKIFLNNLFPLHFSGQGVEKVVKQFHFTTWPDFGVPSDASGMLAFLKKVNKWKAPKSISVSPAINNLC